MYTPGGGGVNLPHRGHPGGAPGPSVSVHPGRWLREPAGDTIESARNNNLKMIVEILSAFIVLSEKRNCS